jgi:hypothetical protein
LDAIKLRRNKMGFNRKLGSLTVYTGIKKLNELQKNPVAETEIVDDVELSRNDRVPATVLVQTLDKKDGEDIGVRNVEYSVLIDPANVNSLDAIFAETYPQWKDNYEIRRS